MNTNLSALFESANLGELHVGRSLVTGALAIIADGDTVICEFPGEHNFCTEHPEYAQLFVAALNAMPKLLDENYKLKHQVRDTCVRAENAEKSLRAHPAGGGEWPPMDGAKTPNEFFNPAPPESGGQGEGLSDYCRVNGGCMHKLAGSPSWDAGDGERWPPPVARMTRGNDGSAATVVVRLPYAIPPGYAADLYTHPPAQASGAVNYKAAYEAMVAGAEKALDEIEDDGPKALKYAAQEIRAALQSADAALAQGAGNGR